MGKRKRPRGMDTPPAHSPVLNRAEHGMTHEAEYIIHRAEVGDARIVTVAKLVLFSTEARDAWMLDPEDSLAVCLAHDGERQPFKIDETSATFSIEWPAGYRIDGDVFIVTEKSGRVRRILGYPTWEILRAVSRAS